MKYKYSKVDEDNLKWFENDMSRATLSEIELRRGKLRGMSPFKIIFKYPISVIAGENGSGKSTLLAMAACAFHNSKNGFKLPERKLPYHTFSDFFLQSSEEIPPEGIEIWYRIKHDGWKKSRRAPDGIGNLYQTRSKKKGGKWSKYGRRVYRSVIFFGIQRVVPHSEKSVSKSYRSYFTEDIPDGWEDEVKQVVGKVLSTKYDTFWMKKHSKYRLPLVTSHGNIYSGFNMGAGENALFEIFSNIYACPTGSLIIMDEIELGLHEKAQKRLIDELKKICKRRKIQIICTTHSPAILKSLPPEGRFYIESFKGKSMITIGISPEYAAGKMAGERSNELDIYCEDGIASRLIGSILSDDIRKRVTILPIGSHQAVIKHMAARYKDRRKSECLAVLDGDQANKISSHTKSFLKALEKSEDQVSEENWFNERLAFLPGETWPEKWIIEQLKNLNTDSLASLIRTSKDELETYIEEAEIAGKHNEIYTLAECLSLDTEHVCCMVTRWLADQPDVDFSGIEDKIINFLQ